MMASASMRACSVRKGARDTLACGGCGNAPRVFGGQLEVWSEHGAGTEMELTIPATIAYGDRAARRLRLFKNKLGTNS